MVAEEEEEMVEEMQEVLWDVAPRGLLSVQASSSRVTVPNYQVMCLTALTTGRSKNT
jgi:hypothetical protein